MGTAPELEPAPTYPAMQFLRRHGDELSIVAAVGTSLTILMGGRLSVSRTVNAVALGGAVALGIRYLRELTDVISDTLLPQ